MYVQSLSFQPPAQQGKLLSGNKASNAWGCLRPPLGGGGGGEDRRGEFILIEVRSDNC